MLRPDSISSSTQAGNTDDHAAVSNHFWAHPDIPATTTIVQTVTRREQWLLESKFSSKALDVAASASMDFGQVAAVSGKYGFAIEHKSTSNTGSVVQQTSINALHTIPAVKLTLDETTLQLSPGCVKDLKLLRKHRGYSLLARFY